MANRLDNFTKNFTVVPNGIIRDNSLSPEARHLFVYMASMDDSWNFNNANLMKDLNCKEQKLRKIIKELIDSGWLSRVERKNNGKFMGFLYTLNSVPCDEKHTTVKSPPLERTNTFKENERVFDDKSFTILWKNYTLTFLKSKGRSGGSKAKALSAYKKILTKYPADEIYSFCENHGSQSFGWKDLERLLKLDLIKQYTEDKNV